MERWGIERGNVLSLLLNAFSIHGIQRLERELEIRNQRIAARLGEVLAYDDTHELHLVRVRRHGVGGNDPAAFA